MRATIALFVGLLLTTSGCGPRQNAIQGEVTLDGQPVGPGSIVFLPIEGTDSRKAAAAILDGRYDIPTDHGPQAGQFRVEISWFKKTGKQIPSADPGMMTEESVEVIPPKY